MNDKDKLAAKIQALEGRMSGSGSGSNPASGSKLAGGTSFSSNSATVLDPSSTSYSQGAHASNSNTNASGVLPMSILSEVKVAGEGMDVQPDENGGNTVKRARSAEGWGGGEESGAGIGAVSAAAAAAAVAAGAAATATGAAASAASSLDQQPSPKMQKTGLELGQGVLNEGEPLSLSLSLA